MWYFDVCNGDADGLIARHQFRLSFPVPAGSVTLITGTKREISLLKRIPLQAKSAQDADFSVFDVSYDQNADQAQELLKAGESHPIEKVGVKLRAMMPWMKKRQIKGAQAAY